MFFFFIFFLLSNPIYTFSRQSLFRWSSECVVIPIRFSVTLLYFILFKRALHNAMVQYLSMSMTFADLRTLPMHDHSLLPGFTFSLCSVFGTELTTHVCLSDICNNRRLLETLANRMRSKSSNESWGGHWAKWYDCQMIVYQHHLIAAYTAWIMSRENK